MECRTEQDFANGVQYLVNNQKFWLHIAYDLQPDNAEDAEEAKDTQDAQDAEESNLQAESAEDPAVQATRFKVKYQAMEMCKIP